MNRKEARFQEKLLRYKGPKRLEPAKRKPLDRTRKGSMKPWKKEYIRRYEPRYYERELDV
jgi:hypothetical protein